ncbi:unannotated protein [freshwater metagenome]|uniref:Unannotated protein n=1 Tax=freshwater metagenome TaxID=449393 RepID=A0A6J7KM16_9ZZZZ
MRTISSYILGYSVANARSSSSHLMVFMPSRWASGAKISRVSRAFFSCCSGDIHRIVRMLCSRSASLMTSTRMSRAMATTILRTVSDAVVCPYLTRSSLVTPSTSRAISSPKSASKISMEYSVSSTVSCSRAAARVGEVIPRSAKIPATASG